jgi:hypothetical protein
MPRVAPAARIRSVVEAISGFKRLQREMDRLCRRDRIYQKPTTRSQQSYPPVAQLCTPDKAIE